MELRTKIAIISLIGVLSGGSAFGVYIHYDLRRPIIEFRMFSYTHLNVNFEDSMLIYLEARNRGETDCYVNFQVSVEKASISNASIPGLSDQLAQKRIENNGTFITISECLIGKETTKFHRYAEVYITPIPDTPKFEVHLLDIDVPFSMSYPLGARGIQIFPTKLTYALTEIGIYSQVF